MSYETVETFLDMLTEHYENTPLYKEAFGGEFNKHVSFAKFFKRELETLGVIRVGQAFMNALPIDAYTYATYRGLDVFYTPRYEDVKKSIDILMDNLDSWLPAVSK